MTVRTGTDRPGLAAAAVEESRCGLAGLQTAINVARTWLRTLMKDARGGLI